jgi:hypothetical protein
MGAKAEGISFDALVLKILEFSLLDMNHAN